MPSQPCARGGFRVPGGRALILPAIAPDGKTYLSTAQAAQAAGVQPPAVRRWVRVGYLEPVATDARGRALYEFDAVMGAEKLARDAAVRTSGTAKRATRARRA